MSVVLRQPNGFEGLGRVHIHVPSDDPSAAKCPDVPDCFVDLDAAVLAVSVCLNSGHDVITAVDEPNRHPAVVPERFEHLRALRARPS